MTYQFNSDNAHEHTYPTHDDEGLRRFDVHTYPEKTQATLNSLTALLYAMDSRLQHLERVVHVHINAENESTD